MESWKEELYHHGILGQKWGVRRYQNEDGTLTAAGRKRRTSELKKEADTAMKVHGWNNGTVGKAIRNTVQKSLTDEQISDLVSAKKKVDDLALTPDQYKMLRDEADKRLNENTDKYLKLARDNYIKEVGIEAFKEEHPDSDDDLWFFYEEAMYEADAEVLHEHPSLEKQEHARWKAIDQYVDACRTITNDCIKAIDDGTLHKKPNEKGRDYSQFVWFSITEIANDPSLSSYILRK